MSQKDNQSRVTGNSVSSRWYLMLTYKVQLRIIIGLLTLLVVAIFNNLRVWGIIAGKQHIIHFRHDRRWAQGPREVGCIPQILLQGTMAGLLSVSTQRHTHTHCPRLMNAYQRMYFLSGQEVLSDSGTTLTCSKRRFSDAAVKFHLVWFCPVTNILIRLTRKYWVKYCLNGFHGRISRIDHNVQWKWNWTLKMLLYSKYIFLSWSAARTSLKCTHPDITSSWLGLCKCSHVCVCACVFACTVSGLTRWHAVAH